MGLGADVVTTMQTTMTLAADVPEQYQTLGQGWVWRPRGLSQDAVSKPASGAPAAVSKTATLRRKRSMRKSHSDRPLLTASASVARLGDSLAAASLQDVAGEASVNMTVDETMDARRSALVARAEEILRGKRCVGILDGATCPVCLMDDVDTQLSACGHLLHAKCIKRWLAKSARCPVCREEVTGVQEAYATPEVALRPMEKDRLTHSSDATCPTPDDHGIDSGDDGFGWFEDFDDLDDMGEDNQSADGLLFSSRRSLPSFPTDAGEATLVNRELSATFEVCRTFQPLRPGYDAPYQTSRHAWLRALPAHRHVAAKLQIRSFRIVEAQTSGAQHAEYLLELQLDGRYVSRWRRFSELARFAGALLGGSSAYNQAGEAWKLLEASSRWFNRLELSYLHQRCRMLEEFAHAVLLECPTAHTLADFVECC